MPWFLSACALNSNLLQTLHHQFIRHYIRIHNPPHILAKSASHILEHFNFFTVIASDSSISLQQWQRDSQWHGTSYLAVAAILSASLERKADKLTPGFSELMCKNELGQNTYLKLCNSRNQQVFFWPWPYGQSHWFWEKSDHCAHAVLEFLCKKNLDQKTQNWRSSPSPSVRTDTHTDADLDLWGQTHGHSVLSILGLWKSCPPKIVSKEAKLAKQDGDDVSDTHTQTDKSKKSLPNNGLEDPILVVNHCVGIISVHRVIAAVSTCTGYCISRIIASWFSINGLNGHTIGHFEKRSWPSRPWSFRVAV